MLDREILAMANQGLGYEEIASHYLAEHRVSSEARGAFTTFVRDCVLAQRHSEFLDIVEGRLREQENRCSV